jgi:diamine N-acetyltransferase
MDVVTLVAAMTADIRVVQRLAHTIWHLHYPGIISVAQIDYMLARGYSDTALARFLHDAGAGLVLAHVADRPVGFAAWQRAGEPATSKLDKLYVLPDFHRRGIGRRMIDRVEASARADGAATLVLNVNKGNAGSIAAYRRCGFVVREALAVDIGEGFVMDDYLMSKPL